MTNQRWVLFCVDQSEMSITCPCGSWTAIKIETDPGHDNYQTGGNVNLHLRVYQSGSSFENIRPGLDNIPLIVTPWCPCTVENSFPRWAPPALSSVCIQQHRTQPGKHQDSSQLNVHHSRSRLKIYLDLNYFNRTNCTQVCHGVSVWFNLESAELGVQGKQCQIHGTCCLQYTDN